MCAACATPHLYRMFSFFRRAPASDIMSLSEQSILDSLRQFADPNTGKDYVSTRAVKNLRVSGADVSFDIELGYPAASQIDTIRQAVIACAKSVPGVGNVSANVFTRIVAHAVQQGVKLLPGVKNIIAVASGKGGVGKSTTAVNLALALAAEGATVGILDADIYGPSQPMMMGIEGRPESADGKTMEPLENYGVQVMSIGFLIEPDNPMIWRGPMATQALEQLLREHAPNRALQKTLTLIHQQAGKLLTMISQLLDFRKSEAGLMKVHAEKTDLPVFVQEILLAFKPLATAVARP